MVVPREVLYVSCQVVHRALQSADCLVVLRYPAASPAACCVPGPPLLGLRPMPSRFAGQILVSIIQLLPQLLNLGLHFVPQRLDLALHRWLLGRREASGLDFLGGCRRGTRGTGRSCLCQPGRHRRNQRQRRQHLQFDLHLASLFLPCDLLCGRWMALRAGKTALRAISVFRSGRILKAARIDLHCEVLSCLLTSEKNCREKAKKAACFPLQKIGVKVFVLSESRLVRQVPDRGITRKR